MIKSFKSPRWLKRAIRVLVFLFLAWLIFAVAFAVTIDFYGQSDRAAGITNADAIFVLGPALERRVDHAYVLWRSGAAPTLVCSGGKEWNDTEAQAVSCRRMLMRRGVPADAILVEDVSLSTEENAIYAQALIEANGWQSVIIVSDDYHLMRADWLFRRIGIDSYSSPASTEELRPRDYLYALFREVAAFHWQVFADLLNLPVTRVEGI